MLVDFLHFGANTVEDIERVFAFAQQHDALDRVILIPAASDLLPHAAEPNKGGHRERAIAAVDQAIAEARAGMAYAGN